jgi:opacity protein-like surface antigen
MEKLNIRFLQIASVALLAGFSSSAFAGSGFRMHTKAPVIPVKKHVGYVFGYGGWDSGASYDTLGSWDPVDPHAHYQFGPTGIPIDWDLSGGWTAGGGIGIYSHLFGGSRFEIEGGYTSNEVNRLTYAGFILPADFDIKTTTVMFNMLKEVPLGQSGVIGYFGGGIGHHSTEMDGDIATILYSDSESGFAWQLIAGLDFPITDRLALFTQYRYLVLSDMTFRTDFGDFINETSSKPHSHAVMVGARVSF